MDKIQEQLDYIVQNMATKDDLKNFATKDDLKNFATKDDLLEMEQRLDIKLAAKADKSDIFEVKELIARIDKRTDEDIRAVMHDIQKLKTSH